MPQTVNVPGVGAIQFPDGMSQQDMAAAIQHNFPQIHGQTQQQAPQSFTGALGHATGVAGRAIANGVLGIPEMAADAADSTINIGNDLIHGRNPVTNDQPVIGSSSQALNTLLTQAGVPQPQGTGEQIESGVIGALAGSKAPGFQAPAQAAPITPNAGQTAGQAMQSPVLQWLEKGLSYLPGGGGIRRAILNQNDALGTKVSTIVDNLRGATGAEPEDAGGMLSDSLKGASNRIKNAAGQQFDAILDRIPNGAKIPVTNAVNTLDDLTAVPQGAEATGKQFIDPRLVQIRQAIEKDMQGASGAGIVGPDGQVIKSGNGMLPIDALRRLKTMLGGMIQWDGPGDATNGALKKVYGSLTQDISSGARAIDPKLSPMIRQANADYQVATAKMDVLNSVVSKSGGPEKIFTSLMSGTKDGASQIREVTSQLSMSDRQLLAAAQLRRMGLANPGTQGAEGGAFSANTFLTNWNRMHPEARAALFGNLPDNYSANVTRLANNAESLKRYANILNNTSGTAPALIGSGEIGSVITSLMTGHYRTAAAIGASAIGTKALAAALTNPKSVAWLARQTAPSAITGLKAAAGATSAAGQ